MTCSAALVLQSNSSVSPKEERVGRTEKRGGGGSGPGQLIRGLFSSPLCVLLLLIDGTGRLREEIEGEGKKDRECQRVPP